MHTDITSSNVLTKLASDATFQRMEHAELKFPSEPILEGEHPIYPSFGPPMSIFEVKSEPVLTDFGSARSSKVTHRGWGMSDAYRAPEMLLDLPWSCEVDNWSIGVMALELLEGRNVFSPFDKVTKQYDLSLALAQYISLLGPPPLEMIRRSENPKIATFFDDQGAWSCDTPVPERSLEDFVTVFPVGKERTLFLKFIRSILTWDPAARAHSAQMFSDEWFMGDAEIENGD